MANRIYRETFDKGQGGWWGWISNSAGPKQLECRDGAVIASSPWWIDYNHAPPGGGYMHLLFCLNTTGPQSEHQRETAGENRFIDGEFPTDFTGAKISLTLKGELAACGAKPLLLIQGKVDGLVSPWLLTSSPFEVTDNWEKQSITLHPDPEQWKCMGSRHDRTDTYGTKPLEKVLSNVNSNILIVLHPLDIVPMGPVNGDIHQLRPEKDYPVWRHRLPEGYVMMDEACIEFAGD